MDEETLEKFKKDLGLLTTDEVVKITGICKPKVLELMDTPEFPVIKIGKCNMVKFSALDEYFKERRILRGE